MHPDRTTDPDLKPFVLFIGGAGRSGSTVLERVLGQDNSYCAAGELTYIWERGLEQDQLCGCGLRFGECDFWQTVVRRAFGQLDAARVAHYRALRNRCMAYASLPRMVWPGLRTPQRRRELAEYGAALTSLYAAISEISGSPVVIDSSKYPSEACLLSELPGIEFALVHLVRDSRGVVFSWQRRKERPEIHWTTAYMPRYSTLQAAAGWVVFNLLFDRLCRKTQRAVRVRYEDFVRDPATTVRNVREAVGQGGTDTPFLDGAHAILQTDHTVSGNPFRFKSGEVELRADQEWVRGMRGWKRRV